MEWQIQRSDQWQIQISGRSKGGNLGQLPPNVCGAPLKLRPSDMNAPFLVSIEVDTQKKYSERSNVLRFVERQDLRAGVKRNF